MKIAAAIVLFTAIVLMLALAGRPGPNDPPGARGTTRGQLALAIAGFLAALIAFALAATSSANAAPLTAALEADYQRALVAWGAPAGPPQCTSVEQAVATSTEIDALGRATQPPPGWSGPCVYWIAAGLSPCEQWAVSLHEVGHLTGHGHTDDPRDPMYVAGDYAYLCTLRDVDRLERGHHHIVTRCPRFTNRRRRRDCWHTARMWGSEARAQRRALAAIA